MNQIILKEGLKIFSRNLNVKFFGLKKYSGTDEEICLNIIKSCYNKKNNCFTASSGNYKVFYARDFGWCIESLIIIGFKKEVEKTLEYALNKYSTNKDITVAIDMNGNCYNFPEAYSPDSVAYFFRSLRISKSKKLILKYRDFLNSQISYFEMNVLSKNDLEVSLKEVNFSGMRDHIKDTKLCYDMIMAYLLEYEINNINKLFRRKVLINPLKKYDLKNNLIKNYWNNKGYFNDSISNRYCSGHSNVYPYFLDIITDKRMLKSSIKNIRKNKLDTPIVLKYGFDNNTKFLWYNIFSFNWEKHTSWAMLGLAYIDIVSKIDKNLARIYLRQYSNSIEQYKCFIEVYDGFKPYKSIFFSSDDSMLWASMYLNLKKKLNKI